MFAEVARGVAGEISGGMDGVVRCVSVCGVHKSGFRDQRAKWFWEYNECACVCV